MADRCLVCGKRVGWLSGKIEVSQGPVCGECLKKGGIGSLNDPYSYNQVSITRFLEERAPIVQKFSPTKSVGEYFYVDDNNKLFKIGNDIFSFDNLLNFELYEEASTTSTTQGGLGRAIVGGALFGGVGAVVGGSTGKRTTISTSSTYILHVTLKNAHTDCAEISNIRYDAARACVSALEIIESENQPQTAVSSIADELIKLKSLMDAGVISNDEFEIAKAKILNK